MKFNVLNNEPLQFFDANGVLIGTIEISGSGDMIIRPESGSSRDIILGNRDTVGDVEIGLPSAEAGLKFMGGGTISANGNTLTIGDSTAGDSVIIAVPITASSVDTASFAITASHALNAGGGGGSTFPFTGDARITGSLIVSGALEAFTKVSNNVQIGNNAGTALTTGNNSVIIGQGAGDQITTGTSNTIIGFDAGGAVGTNVDSNVFIGYAAGKENTSDSIRNVFIGYQAGYKQSGGHENVAIGFRSMANFSTTGDHDYNVAVGGSSLYNLNTGQYNIAIGRSAGYNISNGNNNILIGRNAGVNITTGGSNIIIGSGSLGSTALENQLRIGNGDSIVTISGSLVTGDVIFYNTASAPNFSGSFQGDGSNLTGTGTTIVANPGSSGAGALSTITIGAQSFSVGGGGGGSSIFTAADGFQKTINNLIVSQSNTTSSLTVINSGSTVFDVRGSVGQLFEVQDGLDGVLMSVNDISGIPILTVSSSGDVILAEGSTLQGTAATASFVAGVSAAFPFTGSAGLLGSLDITGSGDDIFKVRSSSGSLFSVDDGLDGILMSVNDISGLPLFEVSSSGDVELVTGNISGSGISTASFGHLLVNGVSISGSGGGGGGSTDISALNAFTGSANTSLSALDTFTGSANTSITALNSATSSFATTASVSLHDLTITNLSGSLIPGDGSTSSIAVTVDGNQKFVLDGTVTASISLTAGNAYKFDTSHNSNLNHPFAFKLASDSSTTYTTGVTVNGSGYNSPAPGESGAYVQISVTNDTPNLIYYCTSHGNGMGGGAVLTIITGSLIQNGFLEVSGSTRLSGSLDVLTDITASGNISGSSVSTASFGTYIGDGSNLTGVSAPSGKFGISNSSGEFTYYATLTLAVAAASSGDVVQMFANVEETGAVEVAVPDGVHIDGNGYTYTLNNAGTENALAYTSAADTTNHLTNIRIVRKGGTFSNTNSACILIGSSNYDKKLHGDGVRLESDFGTCLTSTGAGGRFDEVTGIVGEGIQGAYWTYGRLKSCDFKGTTSYGIQVRNGAEAIECKGESTSNYGIYFISGLQTSTTCIGISDSSIGISTTVDLRDSTGESNSGNGIQISGTVTLTNCTGRSSSSNGIFTSSTSEIIDCTGVSVSGPGIYLRNNFKGTAHNCVAYSSTSTVGALRFLDGGTITNSSIFHEGTSGGNQHAIYTSGTNQVTIIGCDITANDPSSNAIYAVSSGANTLLQNNVYKGMTTALSANVTQVAVNIADIYGNTHVTSSLDNSRIYSGSFSGSFVGDGSGLTGVGGGSSSTTFTQSLFVTPAGNNGTAVVGDMLKPFATILAATHSANVGDTIIVYPGSYLNENDNIVKDGVNYYFHPGAFVSSSQARLINTGDLTHPINFRGSGHFEMNFDEDAYTVSAPSGVFEFHLLDHRGVGSAGSGKSTLTISQTSDAPEEHALLVNGTVRTSQGGNGNSATLTIGRGNTKFDGAVIHSGSAGHGIDISNASANTQINAYVYAANGNGLNANDRATCTQFSGHVETGDQSNNYAIRLAGNYIEGATINAEIIGSIYLSTGTNGSTGAIINGFQRCANSPSSLGAIDIRSGYHVLNQKIQASENIFYSTGTGQSHTIFNGQANITSDYSGKIFNFNNPNGMFVYNGVTGDINKRAMSNTITAGTLIINSYLEHYGSNYPNNTDVFDLSGGTLEINNKIKYFQNTTGSGIVNMTGGYLKLNSAQLIHGDQTGSWAYCVKLTGGQTGSFFNNSFTNLTVFNDSSLFLNQMEGSGSLFFTDKLY